MKLLFINILFACFLCTTLNSFSQSKKILLFASHEDTYYTELIVAVRAFEAAGYVVDIRSSNEQDVSIYTIPTGTSIEETANSLLGSNYADFTQQFSDFFGSNWNSIDDATPNLYPVNGSINDVVNMDEYEALIIAGGTGALDYRVDGNYISQGTGARLLTANEIQATAEKLNDLALDALSKGKPVLAQCHASSLPSFWRIPNTTGPGAETMGYSLLKNQASAGFPEAQTPIDYTTLFVTYNEFDRVTISSPHSSFLDNGKGAFKILTSRDWYPQTVSHAARTLLNVLETYPTTEEMTQELEILIIHGGALDPNNCSPSNHLNDIPCNYGGGNNLPADYTDLVSLLNADSPNDNYQFNVTNLNITDVNLPYTANDQASILSYLEQFDGIVFYKHWSTGLTVEFQNSLIDFVDNGGGILGLHHGLYNDIYDGLNKNILTQELFGATSEMNTWGAALENYDLIATNYGHFVSSYGINFEENQNTPSEWTTTPPLVGSNLSNSSYHQFSIFDELYTNMSFTNGQTFGRAINDITPILSNNYANESQIHTSGFVKLFDLDENETVGKLAYYEVGERKESISINHTFGQVIRNSVFWTSMEEIAPINTSDITTITSHYSDKIKVYPNPTNGNLSISLAEDISIKNISIVDVLGKTVYSNNVNITPTFTIDLSQLKSGVYFIDFETNSTHFQKKIIRK
jgi:putative intracellular protease/amidase